MLWPGLPAAVKEYTHTCPTCQRVKADHLPPAGLLFPRPVPTSFRDVGLPDVLVSDGNTCFTSAFWTGLHARWVRRSSSARHTITTPPVRSSASTASSLS